MLWFFALRWPPEPTNDAPYPQRCHLLEATNITFSPGNSDCSLSQLCGAIHLIPSNPESGSPLAINTCSSVGRSVQLAAGKEVFTYLQRAGRPAGDES